MQRAWSTLTVKSVDAEQRIVEGIASTPSTDRVGDILEPMGAQFSLPMPFLMHHDSRKPVGHVVWAKPNKEGIPVRVKMVRIDEPGPVRDRVEEAWQDIKHGLVRGLSVGFRDIESAEISGTWGLRFLKWDWLELSGVTIPANADASMTTIKSYDLRCRGRSLAVPPKPKLCEHLPPGARSLQVPAPRAPLPSQLQPEGD